MAILESRRRVILIGLVFILTACGQHESVINENEEPNGIAIYTKHCKVCHGGKGDLGVGDAADLSKSEKTAEEKLYIITKGSESGKMTSFKGVLTEKEISAVAAHIEILKK
jgi:mono/diheme cytochrome c family protein